MVRDSQSPHTDPPAWPASGAHAAEPLNPLLPGQQVLLLPLESHHSWGWARGKTTQVDLMAFTLRNFTNNRMEAWLLLSSSLSSRNTLRVSMQVQPMPLYLFHTPSH